MASGHWNDGMGTAGGEVPEESRTALLYYCILEPEARTCRLETEDVQVIGLVSGHGRKIHPKVHWTHERMRQTQG